MKRIHNKDYLGVKFFKLISYLIIVSLFFSTKKNITFKEKFIINQSTHFRTRFNQNIAMKGLN